MRPTLLLSENSQESLKVCGKLRHWPTHIFFGRAGLSKPAPRHEALRGRHKRRWNLPYHSQRQICGGHREGMYIELHIWAGVVIVKHFNTSRLYMMNSEMLRMCCKWAGHRLCVTACQLRETCRFSQKTQSHQTFSVIETPLPSGQNAGLRQSDRNFGFYDLVGLQGLSWPKGRTSRQDMSRPLLQARWLSITCSLFCSVCGGERVTDFLAYPNTLHLAYLLENRHNNYICCKERGSGALVTPRCRVFCSWVWHKKKKGRGSVRIKG